MKTNWVRCIECEEIYSDYEYDLTDDCDLCGAKNSTRDYDIDSSPDYLAEFKALMEAKLQNGLFYYDLPLCCRSLNS